MPDIGDLISREVPCTLSYRPDLYPPDGFIIHFKYRPEVIDAIFLEQMAQRAADAKADEASGELSGAKAAREAFESTMDLVKHLVMEWDLTDGAVRIPIDTEAVRDARIPVKLLNQILTTVTENMNDVGNGNGSQPGSQGSAASLPATTSSFVAPGTSASRRGRS